MRIGFLGAASTGKTTVAKLAAHELGIPYVESCVRRVMALSNATEQSEFNDSPEARLALQVKIKEAKTTQDAAYPHGIFDRTPLDHLAYMMIKCHDTMTDAQFRQYGDEVTRETLNNYEMIFYFPVFREIPYVQDGFRKTGDAYRALQEIVMHGLLVSIKHPRVVPVGYNIPEKRAQMVCRHVRGYRSVFHRTRGK